MSIVVTCANGHRLTARDSLAGKTGHCPACGVEVKIPNPDNHLTSESSILRILGIGQELRSKLAEEDAAKKREEEEAAKAASEPQEELQEPRPKQVVRKKICPQCDWEIDAGYRICPKCRYYFIK